MANSLRADLILQRVQGYARALSDRTDSPSLAHFLVEDLAVLREILQFESRPTRPHRGTERAAWKPPR
jgi:hypothetical protein